MNDAPGVGCGRHGPGGRHGGDDDGTNGTDGGTLERGDRCDRCGETLQWRLRFDGVTELYCPECVSRERSG